MNLPVKMALAAALSFIVVGVGSYGYYLIYHKEEDEDDDKIIGRQCFEIKVQVPRDSVGIVIGRQGSNIKAIEDEFGCKINFLDSKSNGNKDFLLCCVRGADEIAVKGAENAIYTMIANQPLIETFELLIPSRACGRIIGKNGETIRQISLNSNAKISLSQHAEGQTQVLIKGTADQITAARTLLNLKLVEEQEFQSHMEQMVGSRSPRHAPKQLTMSSADSLVTKLPDHERLMPTGSDGALDVFASGIESPDRLWLQIQGPSTVELDKLNETMTTYYTKPECRIINALSEVRVGQLVAAPFMLDDKYYRAEVISITNEDMLILYYMDYGDSAECAKANAFQLRPEYLKLRFQAIECILARVKPRDGEWTTEAIDKLEDLLHVALWKPLTARIHSYRERPTRARREGSPVPCVDLYDTSGPQAINVASVLVQEGFAKWEEETAQNGDSPEASQTEGSEFEDAELGL